MWRSLQDVEYSTETTTSLLTTNVTILPDQELLKAAAVSITGISSFTAIVK